MDRDLNKPRQKYTADRLFSMRRILSRFVRERFAHMNEGEGESWISCMEYEGHPGSMEDVRR